jgi:hypothetical protein
MFSVVHVHGSGDENPPKKSLSGLYDELSRSDREHGEVAVINDDLGWSMSAHRDGRLVFEHLRNGGERHMIPVKKERVINLWLRLIAGDIDGLLTETWTMGYVERKT